MLLVWSERSRPQRHGLADVKVVDNCGGSYDESVSLINTNIYSEEFARDALFGTYPVGNMTSSDLISPGWLAFRKSGSSWFAQGAKSLSEGSYHLAVYGNLTSNSPTISVLYRNARR